MSDPSAGYAAFRRRLDDELRRRDPAALRDFLIAEGQWTQETTTDPEAAMWMMIATSPALVNLRDEAQRWLMTHGHESEAQAIFGAKRTPGKPQNKPPARGNQQRPGGAKTSKPGKTSKLEKPNSTSARKSPRR